jgi:hypothetical protein
MQDVQPQPKPLERGIAQMEHQRQSFHHFLLLSTFARVTAGDFLFNLI